MSKATRIAALAIMGILMLGGNFILAGNGHIDPAYIQVMSAENPITIDGVLDETDWARRFDYLAFGPDTVVGDVTYWITSGVEVKGPFEDTTTTLVKFLHYGLDLYLSLDSDDQSVGKFGTSWEGDGLFMKLVDAGGTAHEFKLYFNAGGTDPDIVLETSGGVGAGWATGAASKNPGTVVNDTSAADAGYTAELLIHLDSLGYTDPYDEIPVTINIFDPDGYLDDMDPHGAVGGYHKTWWGSEWGGGDRTLRLADPPLRTAAPAADTITLDGQLSEAFWAEADSVVIGKGSSLSTGGYYMQWGDVANTYTDQSMATVKFASNGTDLYLGVTSNDTSVCKWSPGWEADGLFLWMTNKGDYAPTARMEIKAMYFSGTEGDGISFETNANVPTGAAEGASFEPTGTVTHSETAGPDAGYSIEVVVHTADFGYATGDTVMLSVVIWDMDYADATAYDAAVADYAPHWWGTQWADPNFEKYFMYRGVILSHPLGVADGGADIPEAFVLHQNYPNPFNPATTIAFDLTAGGEVRLDVYNILGERIATLMDAPLEVGYHEVVWNGRTNEATPASTGVYFYRLTHRGISKTAKMILLK